MAKRSSYRKLLALALVLLMPVCARADNLAEQDKQDMMANLDIIKNLFQARYAPTFWKRDFSGWDFTGEVEQAKDKIRALPYGMTLPLKDYQRMVRDLLLTTKDYHVGVQFHSTESATLPFQVKGAEGRYFIAWVDRDQAGHSVFPFDEGDELVLFDGEPIHDVIQRLRHEELGDASPLTDQALAEMMLTRRSGDRGHMVPRGSVTLGLRALDGRAHNVSVTWDYTKERIQPYRPDPTTPQAMVRDIDEQADFRDIPVELSESEKNEYRQIRERLQKNRLLSMDMSTPLFSGLNADFDREVNGHALGSREGFLPCLGPVTWESGGYNAFHAYIYETEDGQSVGVIRIPHYMCGSWEAGMFRDVLTRMDEEVDMLVIDQFNNPGGSVLYLYGLVAALTDKTMSTPRHKLALTQADIVSAYEIIEILSNIYWEWQAKLMLGPDIGGYPVTMEFVELFIDYCEFMIDEWNAGHRFTEAHHLLGVDYIKPHPEVQFTKPILLLVNELDFSGGDFFPAIMQDNDRVTIMGTRTAGAGGAVQAFEFPNRFGIAGIRNTITLAERADKNPIENLGVTPDIDYSPSVADVTGGYEDLADRIRDVVASMLPPVAKPIVEEDQSDDDGDDDYADGDDDDDDDDYFPFWPDDWHVET